MNTELSSLAGKTAIVTGASYGLGVTFAHALADAGANIVLTARSVEKLQEVKANMASFPVKVHCLPCDVSDEASVAKMVEAAWSEFGQVDILVNNAGQLLDPGMAPEKIPGGLLEMTLRVNVVGSFNCARELAARQLAAGVKGSIINLASITGLAGNHALSYATSKAAVINMTRVMATSWANRGIRVNALCPGYFPSVMTGAALAAAPLAAYYANSAPMRRIGELSELAGPIVFLASDASSYVTGQALAVDGGTSATNGAQPLGEEIDSFLQMAVGELAVPITAAD